MSGKTFPFTIFHTGPIWNIPERGLRVQVPSGATGEVFYNILRPLMTDQTSEVEGFKIDEFRIYRTRASAIPDEKMQELSDLSSLNGIVPFFAKPAQIELEPTFAELRYAANSVRVSLRNLTAAISRFGLQKDKYMKYFGPDQTAAMMSRLAAAQEALEDFALPTLQESVGVFLDVSEQGMRLLETSVASAASAAAFGGPRRSRKRQARTKASSGSSSRKKKAAAKRRVTKAGTGSRQRVSKGRR